MGSPPSSQKPSAASPLRRTQSELQSVQEQDTEKLGGPAVSGGEQCGGGE